MLRSERQDLVRRREAKPIMHSMFLSNAMAFWTSHALIGQCSLAAVLAHLGLLSRLSEECASTTTRLAASAATPPRAPTSTLIPRRRSARLAWLELVAKAQPGPAAPLVDHLPGTARSSHTASQPRAPTAPPPRAQAPRALGERSKGAVATGAVSHLVLELLVGIGGASHAIARDSLEPSFTYSHAYEADPGCRAILACLSAVHLATGTPSEGTLGSVRLLLEPGPESLEAVLGM